MGTDDVRTLIFDTCHGPAAVAGGAAGLKVLILPGLARKALAEEVTRRLPKAVSGERGLLTAARVVARYFETGRLPAKTPRLDLEGVGEFRRTVYEELCRIPAGSTVTYAELARRIGRPGAHRSVGTALSRNPLPIFVPCHRVIRSDGGMGGFTAEGGVELKQTMLALEGALP
jgi:methylated-DNA-[protein]-cysteine S-methyltransferase